MPNDRHWGYRPQVGPDAISEIRWLLKSTDLTMITIADRAGVSVKTVQNINRQAPRIRRRRAAVKEP